MKLIAGLGNPGARYRNTRHNVGFRALDCLAERLKTSFAREKYGALIAAARYETEQLLLMKPLTFMNNSGLAVAQAARNKAPDPGCLLVVVDDVHPPLGRLRFRARGSDGGHNGLASVIERLGTREFARLRMGVGENAGEQGLIDHVLGTFRPEEQPEVEQMVARAADAILCFVRSGIETAMNEFN